MFCSQWSGLGGQRSRNTCCLIQGVSVYHRNPGVVETWRAPITEVQGSSQVHQLNCTRWELNWAGRVLIYQSSEQKMRAWGEVIIACCFWQPRAALQRQRVSDHGCIKGCKGSLAVGSGKVQQSSTGRFQEPSCLCLLAWGAPPLVEHILCWAVSSADWWRSLVKAPTHLSFIQKKWGGRGRERAFHCFADSTDNISILVSHFSSPVWWVITL